MKTTNPSKDPPSPKGELSEAELGAVNGGTDTAPKPPATQSNQLKKFSDTESGIVANLK